MKPPVARAVATARSPSAGLPIASERATVARPDRAHGRSRLEGGCDRCAPGGLAPDEPWRRSVREAKIEQLRERLVQLREERARCDRRDDDIGRAPAELLGDLVGDRLRALGVVAAQTDVHERPRHLPRELDRDAVAVVVRARDRIEGRPVGRGRRQLLRLEVGRAEDGRLQPFGRCTRGDRVRQVPGGRARERRQAELLRLRGRDSDHSVLERVRRVGGVQLQPEVADPELLGEPRGTDERRQPGSEPLLLRRVDREKVGVAPDRRRPSRRSTRESPAQAARGRRSDRVEPSSGDRPRPPRGRGRSRSCGSEVR